MNPNTRGRVYSKDNCQNYAEVTNSFTHHRKLGFIFAVAVELPEFAKLS